MVAELTTILRMVLSNTIQQNQCVMYFKVGWPFLCSGGSCFAVKKYYPKVKKKCRYSTVCFERFPIYIYNIYIMEVLLCVCNPYCLAADTECTLSSPLYNFIFAVRICCHYGSTLYRPYIFLCTLYNTQCVYASVCVLFVYTIYILQYIPTYI